jgi:CheY-like chemotaxis protein
VNLKHAKVLVVEDSTFLRLANERVLTKAGYTVSTAADGEEAVRMAQQELPDVILLDLLLPKLSGTEVLRKLKEMPATAAIPVIVLSRLSQKNEAKLLEAGAAAYLEKSALDLDRNPDRLTAILESVLSQANGLKRGAAQ